ncbi:preprotein translocase subunit SecE [Candidatus Microgenomates bacterium]|nr:preprotein translocase subunit SecE [Candidatus Microgenomates bacterium]
MTLVQQVVLFARGVREEFNKITWPTRAEAIRLSVIVIVISLAVGALVGGLDFVFTNFVNALIKK